MTLQRMGQNIPAQNGFAVICSVACEQCLACVMMQWQAAVLAFTIGLSACKGHEFHPPDQQERVQAAETVYSPGAYDTITWQSADARLQEGNSVYATKCRKCHGPLGEGGTQYARDQNLPVPSLVATDWAYAASIDSVRHRIYVGHSSGMPSFGISALTQREIDAAAHYVLEQLRPDALRTRSPQ